MDTQASAPLNAEIDRASPVPLYFQLARALRNDIVAGRWSAKDRLPSEAELGAAFDVSRATVRQALQLLESENLIVKTRGRGAFVADPQTRSWLLQSSEGFFQDEFARLGLHVKSRILRAERRTLPTWAAEALRTAPNRDGVTLERLRWVEDDIALYVENWLAERYADTVLGLSDDQSLYEELERSHGIRVGGGRRSVEAVAAKKELSRLLQVPANTPLMFVESVSWDHEGRPFDCYRAWVRTDHIRIEIQVASPRLAASGPPDSSLLRTIA